MLKTFKLQIPVGTFLNVPLLPDQNILFRSKTVRKPGTDKDAQVDEREKGEEDKELLCFKCNHILTSSSRKIEVSGHHSHFFTNPAGEKFDLRCFSEAPGCEIKGVPISDFTWFPGYKWTFAFCSNCSVQSGWFYLSRDNSFFGLIRKSFVGEY